MAEAEDSSIGASVSESNSTVQEVFSMFKSYLEDKIEEKSKQIELKGKAEKDVIKLKFKGNQKQYEINAKLEVILTDISKANEQNNQERVSKLVDEAKALIHRRQKLIKIADRSKDGWRVVEEYESDDLASNSEDEKRLRKAIESAGRKWKIETNKVQQKSKRTKCEDPDVIKE
jgi:phage terminase small subunit